MCPPGCTSTSSTPTKRPAGEGAGGYHHPPACRRARTQHSGLKGVTEPHRRALNVQGLKLLLVLVLLTAAWPRPGPKRPRRRHARGWPCRRRCRRGRPGLGRGAHLAQGILCSEYPRGPFLLHKRYYYYYSGAWYQSKYLPGRGTPCAAAPRALPGGTAPSSRLTPPW